MNNAANAIVAIKRIFSMPRFVLYTLLAPPKTPDKPAPLLWSKIEIISKIAITN